MLWNFIDWQPAGEQVRGEPARLALNGIYYGALQTAARILRLKYGARAADALLAKRAALGRALRKRLEAGGAACGEHALAYAAWAGLTNVGLDDMASSVSRIHDLSAQIATAAEEQSAVTEEINQNMVAIRHMVDDLVASGQQTDRSTDALLASNRRLVELVNRFKVR